LIARSLNLKGHHRDTPIPAVWVQASVQEEIKNNLQKLLDKNLYCPLQRKEERNNRIQALKTGMENASK
jgi:hypothetical protein